MRREHGGRFVAGSAGESVLRAEGLSVWAGAAPLVREVSLSLSSGATTAVVGESGSGKSLTAKALVGLLPGGVRACGTLHLGEQTFDLASEGPQTGASWRALRGSSITLLLQDPFTSLSPVHSVRRQLRAALRLGGHRVTEVLLQQRLEEVGLHPRVLRQYPHELSGGMRQRLAMVLALAADPAVLIADEPTTALDSLTQHELLQLIDELKRARGMAVLLISHDLDVVAGHADTVYVMSAGSVVESGSAAAVLRQPLHPYTRGLLAAAPRAGRALDWLPAPWLPDPEVQLPTGARWGDYAPAAELRLEPIPQLIPLADGSALPQHAAVYGAEPGAVLTRAPVSDKRADRERVSRAANIASASDTANASATGLDAQPAAPEPILLTVRELDFFRGSRQILDDVSFEVRAGEILGMVGQSGSGKTTIARLIAGLEYASGGTIEIDGAPPARGAVQMVFQDPAGTLNPALTVRRTLREALLAAENRTDTPESLLADVGLDAALITQRPRRLSGGQRQRVAIARALAARPRLLLCDEAVSALDVSVQAQILALLHTLRRERGQSMLFITHDLAVVGQLCDRVVVLNEGRIVDQGDTAQLLASPRDPYTKRLLAAGAQTADAQTAGT